MLPNGRYCWAVQSRTWPPAAEGYQSIWLWGWWWQPWSRQHQILQRAATTAAGPTEAPSLSLCQRDEFRKISFKKSKDWQDTQSKNMYHRSLDDTLQWDTGHQLNLWYCHIVIQQNIIIIIVILISAIMLNTFWTVFYTILAVLIVSIQFDPICIM